MCVHNSLLNSTYGSLVLVVVVVVIAVEKTRGNVLIYKNVYTCKLSYDYI